MRRLDLTGQTRGGGWGEERVLLQLRTRSPPGRSSPLSDIKGYIACESNKAKIKIKRRDLNVPANVNGEIKVAHIMITLPSFVPSSYIYILLFVRGACSRVSARPDRVEFIEVIQSGALRLKDERGMFRRQELRGVTTPCSPSPPPPPPPPSRRCSTSAAPLSS